MRQFIWLVPGWLLLGSAVAGPPMPVESQYLVTLSANFVIVGREGVKYDMSFGVRQPFDRPVYLTVDFEDPEDPATPLFVEMELPAGQAKVDVLSPAMKAVRNRKEYWVKVSIFEDARRKKPIGTHEQTLELKMPRGLLKALNVRLL
jgi:hypothetical protein